MSRDVFYKIIIVAMLLLNIGMLGYLWKGNGPVSDSRPHRPDGLIIERLQLDESQQEQFSKLRNRHHEHAMQLREESKRLHDALFRQLRMDVLDNNRVDSLENLINVNDREKEQLNFNHFKELKTILKPEQQPLYKDFIEEIARQFGPPPPGGGRP